MRKFNVFPIISLMHIRRQSHNLMTIILCIIQVSNFENLPLFLGRCGWSQKNLMRKPVIICFILILNVSCSNIDTVDSKVKTHCNWGYGLVHPIEKSDKWLIACFHFFKFLLVDPKTQFSCWILIFPIVNGALVH